MAAQQEAFFSKKKIDIANIMYITRENGKTVLHFADGRRMTTYHPIKRLLEALPKGSFEVVNKGIALSPAYLIRRNKNTFIMADGSMFPARIHQKKNVIDAIDSVAIINRRFSVMNDSPLPFCVVEMLFDEDGGASDFVFRYCNKAMEQFEGKTLDELLDRSFYDVFENGDKKWLTAYKEVALNGISRVIESDSPEIGRNIRVFCFQPMLNFCACALINE